MLNQGGITSVSGTTRNLILMAPELAFTVSCKIANTGLSADSDGKKLVKAGTPLYGSLTARDTAFTAVAPTVGENDPAPVPVGICLHDVDVTSGTKNSQVTTFGFVDVSKLETAVATALAAATPAGITLVK